MNFEDVMMKRLANCHAEACDEVLKSVKAGRPIGDAVLDAIEALPKSQTRALRQWARDWELIGEWQDKWVAHGWKYKASGRTNFEIVGPLLNHDKRWSNDQIMHKLGEWRADQEVGEKYRWRGVNTIVVPETLFPREAIVLAISGAQRVVLLASGVRGSAVGVRGSLIYAYFSRSS